MEIRADRMLQHYDVEGHRYQACWSGGTVTLYTDVNKKVLRFECEFEED